MLLHLHIRDFAIIDELQLEFAPGFTVLSGETGAGKSILIDALGLLLGDRADSSTVRSGAERAEVSASFDMADAKAARGWLSERDLLGESDADCLLRRTLTPDGKGRCFINGAPATVRDLKELGELLLDIHGQQAHQSLLKSDIQRELVDDFGEHQAQLGKLREVYEEYRTGQARLQQLAGADGNNEQRIEFLRYQLQELSALGLKPGEAEELDTEHRRLSHAGQLLEEGQRALGLIYEDDQGSAYRALGQATQILQRLTNLDPGLSNTSDALAPVLVQLKDAASTLRNHLDGLDLDPSRLQWLDARIGAIHNLARKHHLQPPDLIQRQAELQAELAGLEGAGEEIEALRQRETQLLAEYRQQAVQLSKLRQQTATRLAGAVQTVLRQLGMPQGRFEIQLNPLADTKPRPQGSDQIDYLVSANPGQEPRPLGKVASGGELSRISLAIQVVAARSTQVPSLIFDEIDAGIGGGVAEIVGRQLHKLGTHRQTLCVTHLPQVAAQAQQHMFVRKEVRKGATFTRVEPLQAKARVEEIARMLGGVEITTQTRAHAKDMLQRAEA
ncbi:MAG: DNA repair protein RecN [Nevskiales bacterium]